MDDGILIRSNLVSGFETHVRFEAEKEAREKAEREAKLAAEAAERKRLDDEFKALHPNLCAYTYVGRYSFETYNPQYSGYCKVHFYEWSDVHRVPLEFSNYGSLYIFLDDSGLLLESFQVDELRKMRECFMCCVSGQKRIVLCESYEELVRELHKAEALGRVLAVV